MERSKLRIGNILRVTQGGDYHYEQVVQIIPDILTVDMPDDEDAEVSTQGLSDNLQYELIPNHTITMVFKSFLPRGVAFGIADRFYGSDYAMADATFEGAVEDTKYNGVTGIKIK